jgi:hypothetical protein
MVTRTRTEPNPRGGRGCSRISADSASGRDTKNQLSRALHSQRSLEKVTRVSRSVITAMLAREAFGSAAHVGGHSARRRSSSARICRNAVSKSSRWSGESIDSMLRSKPI